MKPRNAFAAQVAAARRTKWFQAGTRTGGTAMTHMRKRVGLAAWLSVLVGACGCNGAISPEGRRCLQDAQAAYRRGDNPRAVQTSSRFLQLHPRTQEAGEAYYIRGLARCQGGQEESGKADLVAALGLTRRKDLTALVQAKLADLAYRDGDLPEADKRYRAVLLYVPPGAPPADQAMFRLGTILQRRGQWRQGASLFRKVRHLFPGTKLAKLAEAHVTARRWSVQAGAFRSAAGAERLRKRLAGAGLPARVDLGLRGDELMRLVRVGAHHTYDAARDDLAKVRKLCADAFIAPAD